MLATGEPELPFCICWANENWTRRWDGLDHEILVAQTYAPGDAQAFVRSLYPLLRDHRYIKVNGRPLVAVYKAADISRCRRDSADVARNLPCRWRRRALPRGRRAQRGRRSDRARLRRRDRVPADRPRHREHHRTGRGDQPRVPGNDLRLPQSRRRLSDAAATCLSAVPSASHQAWDNTPRRQSDGTAFVNSSPATFRYWLEQTLRQTLLRHGGDERLVFVNAWNEWAEGSYLEPDARFGRQYLEAVRDARGIEAEAAADPPSMADITRELEALVASSEIVVTHAGVDRDVAPGGLSIVMPVYNHAPFLPRTLAALTRQAPAGRTRRCR